MISSPALTLVFRNLQTVKQVQLYQPDNECLIVRVVKNHIYNQEAEKEIIDRLKLYLGKGTKIKFEYRDQKIENEKSGKYRFAISDIV